MNKKQRIVIMIGLGLILLTGLFPYYGQYIGYYFIFTPPHRHRISFDSERTEGAPSYYGNISVSRFFMQTVTISLLTIGLVFLFADRKENKNGK